MLTITQPPGLQTLPLWLKAAVDELTTITAGVQFRNTQFAYNATPAHQLKWDVISSYS